MVKFTKAIYVDRWSGSVNEKRGSREMWAVGHLNEMYVRDVHAIQKNMKLEGNLNYDNDVYSSSTWSCVDFPLALL